MVGARGFLGVLQVMSNPKGRGGRDGLGGSQGHGHLIPRELFESPRAPESQNHISETQGDDLQARDFGDHVSETPNSHREEGEGSNCASKRVYYNSHVCFQFRFDDNKISGSTTDIFQGHFRKPWSTTVRLTMPQRCIGGTHSRYI